MADSELNSDNTSTAVTEDQPSSTGAAQVHYIHDNDDEEDENTEELLSFDQNDSEWIEIEQSEADQPMSSTSVELEGLSDPVIPTAENDDAPQPEIVIEEKVAVSENETQPDPTQTIAALEPQKNDDAAEVSSETNMNSEEKSRARSRSRDRPVVASSTPETLPTRERERSRSPNSAAKPASPRRYAISRLSGCRIYVGNLPYNCEWQELKDFGRQAGDVINAEILKTIEGKSKGCGILSYSSPEEAKKAISVLDGKLVLGRKVFLREDREETFSKGPTDGILRAPGGPANPCRVFVSNLPYTIRSKELEELFKKAGEVVHGDIMVHAESGRSKGSGTVLFATPQGAKKSIELFHKYFLQGREIEVREDRGSRPPPPEPRRTYVAQPPHSRPPYRQNVRPGGNTAYGGGDPKRYPSGPPGPNRHYYGGEDDGRFGGSRIPKRGGHTQPPRYPVRTPPPPNPTYTKPGYNSGYGRVGNHPGNPGGFGGVGTTPSGPQVMGNKFNYNVPATNNMLNMNSTPQVAVPNQGYNQAFTSSVLGGGTGGYQQSGAALVPGLSNPNPMYSTYGGNANTTGFGFHQTPATGAGMPGAHTSTYPNMLGTPNSNVNFFPQPGASAAANNMNVMNMLQGLSNAMQAAGTGQGLPGNNPGFGTPANSYSSGTYPNLGYNPSAGGYNPNNFYNPS